MSKIDEIKNTIVPILKKEGVLRSALFGSYVKGTSNDKSDLDILVELPKEKSIFDFIDLKLKLEDALHLKVDLVEYEAVKPLLREEILSHQAPLF